jgi:phage terminase small subunit
MARKKKDDAQRMKFARAYHAKPNGADAAKAAGYKGTRATLRSVASRLLRRQDVKDELTRLGEKTETDAIASREEALRTLTQQLRFDPGKYMKFNAVGELESIDLQEMARDGSTGVLAEVTIDETASDAEGNGGGRKVRVKWSSKSKALDQLARYEGWLAAEKHEHDHRVRDLTKLSDAELEAEAQRLGVQMGRGK